MGERDGIGVSAEGQRQATSAAPHVLRSTVRGGTSTSAYAIMPSFTRLSVDEAASPRGMAQTGSLRRKGGGYSRRGVRARRRIGCPRVACAPMRLIRGVVTLVVLVCVTGTTFAQQAPAACGKPLPQAAPFNVPQPRSDLLAWARTMLRRWPGDVVTTTPRRDSLEHAIADALRQGLGVEQERVLLYVMVDADPAARAGPPYLPRAAAHFYLRLALPRANLDDLLGSADVDLRTREALMWELSMAEGEERTVGRGRLRMVCDLAQRFVAGNLHRAEEKTLLATTLTVLQAQSRHGNTDAALLLDDPVVRAARSKL